MEIVETLNYASYIKEKTLIHNEKVKREMAKMKNRRNG